MNSESIHDRLQGLRNSNSSLTVESAWKPSTRRWLAVGAGFALLLLIVLFIEVMWTLHGSPFIIGPDGWAHVIDRDAGFQLDLPGWYSAHRYGPKSVNYTSRFHDDLGTRVYVSCRPYRLPLGTTVASEFAKNLETFRQDGASQLKIVVDKSHDPNVPLIDFVVTKGTGEARWSTRKRYVVHQDVWLEIEVHNPGVATPADVERVFESVHWNQ